MWIELVQDCVLEHTMELAVLGLQVVLSQS
jgi:hypothetical protein